MTNNILNQIRQTLIKSSDEQTRIGSQHYFKETVTVYGVKAAIVKMPEKLKEQACRNK
jgi:3-methyladenine DNA glycosylase AlkD